MALPATHIRSIQPAGSDYSALWAGVGPDRQRISRIGRQVDRIMGDETVARGIYGAFEQMVSRWKQETAAVKDGFERQR
jgi:hypothetical protein